MNNRTFSGRPRWVRPRTVGLAASVFLWLAAWTLAPSWSWACSPGWRTLAASQTAIGQFHTFEISPDGIWVVFAFDPSGGNVRELYSVPIDGSRPPLRISGLLPALGMGGFEITADSQTVVYRAEQDTGGVMELYSVPIEGGQTTKLNGPLVGGRVATWDVSPMGDRVIYVTEGATGGTELYSVPIAGGSSTSLSGPLGSGRGIAWTTFPTVAPQGLRVVYSTWNPSSGLDTELYSVPIAGGTNTRLDDPGPAGDGVSSFSLSSDGGYVVYQDATSPFELYSVPIAGGVRVKLNGALVSGGNVGWWAIDPSSRRVVYTADQQVNDFHELYSVSVAGSGRVKLSEGLTHDSVVDFEIGPQGDRVSFQLLVQGAPELYSVPTIGGLPVRLSGTMGANRAITSHRFSPDGRWIVYQADEIIDEWYMLFRAAADGSGGTGQLISVLLNDPDRDDSWQFDPSRPRVVLLSNEPFADSIVRPWEVPLEEPLYTSGREMVDELDFFPDENVVDFEIGPDGSVVYSATQLGFIELFVVQCFSIFSNGFEPSQFWDGAVF